MSRARSLALGLFAIVPALSARADEQCLVKPFRWQEDCSFLRDTPASLSDIDRFRYIPLDDAGSVWLTFGGEYRAKLEALDAPDFDLRRTDQAFTAIGQRWYVNGDLRTATDFRVFAQFSAAEENGRKPIERPFDKSEVDLAQLFVDIPVPIFESTILRIGRQELDGGGNRLISTRDAANLRRAFDMVHLESTIEGFQIAGFYGRPVLNSPEAFDDGTVPGELFYGGFVRTHILSDVDGPLFEGFVFQRDRRTAIYEQSIASDHRTTVGVRLSGGDETWDYAGQAAHQSGSFGAATIDAPGFAGDAGWHPDLWARPRFGASFGYAGGDDRPGDRTLGTFDVLYPNLGYFTDAPVYYPGNTVDFQPNATLNFAGPISVRGGCDFIYRISRHDAVYGPPGIPLLPGTGSGPSFVTALSYLRGDWTITHNVALSASYVHGSIGSLIRDAHGHAFNYGGFSIDLHA